MFSSRTADF